MPDSVVVEYEMGYGANEFGKVLNGPFTGEQYRCSEIERHHWSLEQSDQTFELNILVIEKPARELGLFKLPVLAVKFSFTNTEVSLRERFFKRFHQYFHKGGG